jgi:methyl-accepting chemotaxis protein
MARLGLRAKLAIGFALLLAMLVALGGMAYVAIQRVTAATEEANTSLRKKELAAQLEIAVRKEIQSANDNVFNGDANSAQKYGKAKEEMQQKLDELGKVVTDSEAKALLMKFDQSVRQISSLTEQEIDLRRQGRNYEATDMAFGPKEEQAIKDVADDAAQFEIEEDKLAQRGLDTEHRTEARANFITFVVVLGGFCVGAIAAILIVRSVTGSLKMMLRMIERIADKDLTLASLEVSSNDEIGKAEAALNTMKDNLSELIHSIAAAAREVNAASEQMSAVSGKIMTVAEETSTQATVVSGAAQQVSSNLETVATGSGQMSVTIQSIASNAQEAAIFAEEAVKTARAADVTVTKLGESSAEIDGVVKAITAIAQQTNLLALNATIEAARAGEAGKGFAVVANEVKELAKQTAKATEDIGSKIAAIQQDSRGAVETIASIHGVIQKISGVSATIASAVEEQSATTEEMSRNVNEAATGANGISKNVIEVANAAQRGTATAQESQCAVEQLAEMSSQLNGLVAQFKIGGRGREAETERPRSMAAAGGAR